jgi:hydroxypyruvate reductase
MNSEQDLKSIFLKAVAAVDPFTLITGLAKKEGNVLSVQAADGIISEDLLSCKEVLILGVGKASCRMAQAMEQVLADSMPRGLVVTKYGQGERIGHIKVVEAGHPVPDGQSLEGARALMRLAQEAGERTLLINLISGGGSALACLPADGISLEDKKKTTELLLKSGADIGAVNCVRKHISGIKGGKLAKAAWPARMINLILSDVVGDNLATIASGITVPDPTTFCQALDFLEKYHIRDKVPGPVRQRIESGTRGDIPETPKEGDPCFSHVENILIGNNRTACLAAERHGKELGYDTMVLADPITGEAREAAALFASLAADVEAGKSGLKKPVLIIAGGETTVTIQGTGTGGRNQEMALAFAVRLMETRPDFDNIYFLSAGTDGIDGPTDAAGALVSPDIRGIIRELGLNPRASLADNDSYRFFGHTGHLFRTGQTGTNVCDIQLLMVS